MCKIEWTQRERERKIEEKMWRGDQKGKGGRREGKGRKGKKMRVYLNPEGRGLSCFEEEFRRI